MNKVVVVVVVASLLSMLNSGRFSLKNHLLCVSTKITGAATNVIVRCLETLV